MESCGNYSFMSVPLNTVFSDSFKLRVVPVCSFFLVCDIPLYTYPEVIHSVVEGNRGGFPCLTMRNNAGKNVFVHIFWVCLSVGHGIAKS